MMVMILERTSLRLLTASVMMAMELDMKPITALNPTRTRLARMLMILVFTTVDSRLDFILWFYYSIFGVVVVGIRVI